MSTNQSQDVGSEPGSSESPDTVQLHRAQSCIREGRFEDAEGPCRRALVQALHSGDVLRRAEALTLLGVLDRQHGHYVQAAERYRTALRIARDRGDDTLEARILRESAELKRIAQG